MAFNHPGSNHTPNGPHSTAPCDHYFKLIVVFTPCDVVLSSNQRAVTVLVCV